MGVPPSMTDGPTYLCTRPQLSFKSDPDPFRIQSGTRIQEIMLSLHITSIRLP